MVYFSRFFCHRLSPFCQEKTSSSFEKDFRTALELLKELYKNTIFSTPSTFYWIFMVVSPRIISVREIPVSNMPLKISLKVSKFAKHKLKFCLRTFTGVLLCVLFLLWLSRKL